MLASNCETLQYGTSNSKVPFQKRATGFQLYPSTFTGAAWKPKLWALSVLGRDKFRKAYVAEALKGYFVL